MIASHSMSSIARMSSEGCLQAYGLFSSIIGSGSLIEKNITKWQQKKYVENYPENEVYGEIQLLCGHTMNLAHIFYFLGTSSRYFSEYIAMLYNIHKRSEFLPRQE